MHRNGSEPVDRGEPSLPNVDRRTLLSAFASLPAFAIAAAAQAQTAASGDPLPLKDGPAKQTILKFVRETTDTSSPNFVPPEERIVFEGDCLSVPEDRVATDVYRCRTGPLRPE